MVPLIKRKRMISICGENRRNASLLYNFNCGRGEMAARVEIILESNLHCTAS